MKRNYYGPMRGSIGYQARFVVRGGSREVEIPVQRGQIQISLPIKVIEDIRQDEWDYDNEQRGLRMKGNK